MFGGEKKGLVHYEEAIACFSLLPPCLPYWCPKSNNISTNENRDDSQMQNPPHLFKIVSRSTRFG